MGKKETGAWRERGRERRERRRRREFRKKKPLVRKQRMIGNESRTEPLLPPARVTTTTAVPEHGFTFMLITILLEVSGTLCLRHALDDARFSFVAYALYFAGFSMFSFSLRYVSLSIAYTTWCALGTIGVTLASRFLYAEDISLTRWICIACTVPPVVGMYLLP